MPNYLLQNSSQTLAAGIAEYYAAHAEQLRTRELTPEAKEFFRCHDVVHVLFGCDTSLNHELVVKLSSIFGTDAGMSVLKGYRLPESKEVYVKLSLSEVLATTAKSLFLIPRTLFSCFRMRKRWPWDAFDGYLNVPLERIRKEYGVSVVGR